jgi:hypothetical protein
MPNLPSMGNVMKVTLRKRRNDCGEYVVRAYDADGKRLPDCDYFTDDVDDAVATYNAMCSALDLCNDYSI